jgi:hypothetical protein
VKPSRQPRGPTFWLAVGLALIAAVVFVVDFRELFRGHPGPVAILAGTFAYGFVNCIPMLLALGLVLTSRQYSPTIRFAGYGFSVGAAGLVLFGHIMWAFDIAKTATGSSTGTLLFGFLRARAVIVGAMAALPGGVIGFSRGLRAHRAEPKRP